jgi:hypothetical protein
MPRLATEIAMDFVCSDQEGLRQSWRDKKGGVVDRKRDDRG